MSYTFTLSLLVFSLTCASQQFYLSQLHICQITTDLLSILVRTARHTLLYTRPKSKTKNNKSTLFETKTAPFGTKATRPPMPRKRPMTHKYVYMALWHNANVRKKYVKHYDIVFTVAGPQIWNSLPADLRLSTCLVDNSARFRRLLKGHVWLRLRRLVTLCSFWAPCTNILTLLLLSTWHTANNMCTV